MYDNNREDMTNLKAIFEGLELEKVRSITLSGNSYHYEACKWIANEVI